MKMNNKGQMMIPVARKPSVCPSCDKSEDIKRVCRHCGHEYVDDAITGWEVLGDMLCLAVFLWLFITLITWLSAPYKHTLVSLLSDQWEWFKAIKVW